MQSEAVGAAVAEPSAFDSDAGYRRRLAQEVLRIFTGDSPLAAGGVPASPGNGTVDARRQRVVLQKEDLRRLLVAAGILQPDEAVPAIAKLMEQFGFHPDTQSRVALVTQYTTSKWLLEQELIAQRFITVCPAGNLSYVPDEAGKVPAMADPTKPLDVYEAALEREAVGVCFSGGGIRSATFNLGVLQGLAELKKLKDIDYLSTVSGGGYIHQFLAAWLKNEGAAASGALSAVESELRPIPEDGSGRVLAPEPVRWLRRYSNYLSPSVSAMGADVWTIVEIWMRNTVLNFVILGTAIMFLLTLPHLALTDFAATLHMPTDVFARKCLAVGLGVIGGLACLWLFVAFPRYRARPDQTPDGDACPGAVKGDSASYRGETWTKWMACLRCGTRAYHPRVITGAWLLLSICAAVPAYRHAVPGGGAYSGQATKDYVLREKSEDEGAKAVDVHIRVDAEGAARCEGCASGKTGAATKSDAKPPSRVKLAWGDRPTWTALAVSRAYRSLSGWSGWRGATPVAELYDLLPVLCAVFCFASWFAIKETTTVAQKLGGLAFLVPALLFAAGQMLLVEYLFFALSFTVQRQYVVALGIALMPSLLLAVPFITLELYGGLMGIWFSSSQREWTARLRALSFQWGMLWIALCGVALMGPQIVHTIASMVVLKWAALSGWVATTVSGVVLGQSRSTSGKPKDGEDPGAGAGNILQEVVVQLAPPVFVLGLFLLLSDLVGFLIAGGEVGQPHEPAIVCGVFLGSLLLICVGFAWRVDINEFSMNSFYRDRLSRCYAGASNPERKPNVFSGFDPKDGSWRVADLLPTSWHGLDGRIGTYHGPFPIFCTALNVTTGKDLAYQERKAASFGITPLYTGYSTGWTDARSADLQYNGFVPTVCHVKRGKGMTMASAVAISGAAASPNMGYHSSAATAFLMTVFNVRLGWWMRNTRHRTETNDSPTFGLFYLLNELRGSTDDTSSHVYLSDGGHFENMGLYELIRRRCRTIVVCDAEADGNLCFEGIGMAIRKARIDFGVEIEINRVLGAKPNDGEADANPAAVMNDVHGDLPEPETRHAPTGAEGLLKFQHFPGNVFHALEGTIRYPEDVGPPTGKLLYIKSTLTGDEPADIVNYHRVHPAFPFDTTLDQFFSESQFESYRRLGEHILLESDVRDWMETNLV